MQNESKPTDSENTLFFEVGLAQKEQELLSEVLPDGFAPEEAHVSEREALKSPEQLIEETIDNKDNIGSKDNEVTKASLQQSTTKRVRKDHKKKELKNDFENKIQALEFPSSTFWKVKNEAEKKCYELLQKLKNHECAALFLGNTITSKRQKAAIQSSEKLDLTAVENKLKSNEYKCSSEFGADIKKIWNNALKSSIKGSEIHTDATEMSTFFEAQFIGLENLRLDEVSEMDKKVDSLSKQIIDLHNIGGGARHIGSKPYKHSSEDKRATLDEKKTLHNNIQKLPPEHLRGVWEIIIEEVGNISNNKEVLEFNVNALPVRVIRELEYYVQAKLKSMKKKNKEKSHKKEKKSHKEAKGSKKDASARDNASQAQKQENLESSYKKVHLQESAESGQGFKQLEQEKSKEHSQKENDMTSESSFISDSDDE